MNDDVREIISEAVFNNQFGYIGVGGSMHISPDRYYFSKILKELDNKLEIKDRNNG
tara:strand:+ start:118 stop:285 length:168 start_codon:yes stop_codon:yes gene_type:complete